MGVPRHDRRWVLAEQTDASVCGGSPSYGSICFVTLSRQFWRKRGLSAEVRICEVSDLGDRLYVGDVMV
jgi:hypothetical protein